jgi:hypothetical protein
VWRLLYDKGTDYPDDSDPRGSRADDLDARRDR